MAADYYKHTRCGHNSTAGIWGTGQVLPINDLCHACRTARLGQVIDFIRFGSVPAGGRSRNHRDRTAEEGVSVYEVTDGRADLVGWHFDFLERPAYVGRGEIVGWGSDGEPLVLVVGRVRRATPDQVVTLTS